jgi:hypothetical protein
VQLPGNPFAARHAHVGVDAHAAGMGSQPMLSWHTAVPPIVSAFVVEQTWVAASQYDPPQANPPAGGVQREASVVSMPAWAASQTVA